MDPALAIDIPANGTAAASRPRRPALAALMSLVLPGWGQLYNGELNRAIWLFLGFVLLTVPGPALIALHLPPAGTMAAVALGLLATLALWGYGVAQAWRRARLLAGYVPAPWQLSGVYLLVLLLCDFIALPLLTDAVRQHQVASFRIPSASMAPTLQPGDVLFADKRYNCPGCKQRVQRGDIAIFTYPNDRTQLYVKRIVGLPGDRLSVTHGQVRLLADGAAAEAGTVVTVPPGQVYVMGDNVQASIDSRQFGTVPLPDVVGRVRQIWFSAGDGRVRWERLGLVPR